MNCADETLLTSSEYCSIEAVAKALADRNQQEAAWALRGLLDALDNQVADPPEEYRKEYLRGYASYAGLE